jgi:hypothetical protein
MRVSRQKQDSKQGQDSRQKQGTQSMGALLLFNQ